MITAQHRTLLQQHILQSDSLAIHQLLSQFSVADQKQAKQVIARNLADRKICPVESCIRIYAELMQQNLNLYFKTFALACESLRNEPAFWQNLELLHPIGLLFQTNKIYYRQTVVRTLTHQIKPEQPVSLLFEVMQITEPRAQLIYLLEADSLFACYQLIHLATQHDIDAAFLTKCTKQLLTNDKSSLPFYVREDVVNFITHYFNGVNVRYPFTRTFDPTLLSYAERSYDAFCKVIIPANRIKL